MGTHLNHLGNFPSRHDWKIVDWDVKPQHKQTKPWQFYGYPLELHNQGSSNEYLQLIPFYGELKKIIFMVMILSFWTDT